MSNVIDIKKGKSKRTEFDKALKRFWDSLRVPSDCGNPAGQPTVDYFLPAPNQADVVVPREASILPFPIIRRIRRELDK